VSLRCFACLLLVLCAARPVASLAQTFTVLHSFNYTSGTNPLAGLVQATDGKLGSATSPTNLSDSMVFTINPTRTLTMLHIFDSTNSAIN